jgi:tRNA threonylcarbamoyl adenosine modification protein YjeE
VLLLTGELGSGKTVLARGVAAALGIDPRQVLSPSFNLIREHRGAAGHPPRLVHVDLYRLEPQEAAALGLDEVLAGAGVKVVEWAERLPEAPPAGPATLALHLRRLPGGEGGEREIVEIVEIVPEEVRRNSTPERGREGASPSPPEGGRGSACRQSRHPSWEEGERGDAGGDPIDALSSPRSMPISSSFIVRESPTGAVN